MGLHEDLNVAAKMATREMLNFVVETKGLPRDDADQLWMWSQRVRRQSPRRN